MAAIIILAYGLEGLGYIVTGTFIVSIADQTGVFHGEPANIGYRSNAAIPSCIIWSNLRREMGLCQNISACVRFPSLWYSITRYMGLCS